MLDAFNSINLSVVASSLLRQLTLFLLKNILKFHHASFVAKATISFFRTLGRVLQVVVVGVVLARYGYWAFHLISLSLVFGVVAIAVLVSGFVNILNMLKFGE